MQDDCSVDALVRYDSHKMNVFLKEIDSDKMHAEPQLPVAALKHPPCYSFSKVFQLIESRYLLVVRPKLKNSSTPTFDMYQGLKRVVSPESEQV